MRHIDIIKDEFKKRNTRNSLYSLRAFANDLDLNSGALSEILKLKRKFPKSKASRVLEALKLPKDREKLFIESLNMQHLSISKLKSVKEAKIMELESFKLNNEQIFIERWEPFAILNFIETRKLHKQTISSTVSKYFSISEKEANEFIQLLAKLQYIRFDENNYAYRSVESISTSNDIPSSAIKNAHRNIIDLAKEHLGDDVDSREFQAVTIKASKEKMAEAKSLIRDFAQKLNHYLESDEESTKDVFQLNIQFFPYHRKEDSVIIENTAN